jgi:hypothetical protein
MNNLTVEGKATCHLHRKDTKTGSGENLTNARDKDRAKSLSGLWKLAVQKALVHMSFTQSETVSLKFST